MYVCMYVCICICIYIYIYIYIYGERERDMLAPVTLLLIINAKYFLGGESCYKVRQNVRLSGTSRNLVRATKSLR